MKKILLLMIFLLISCGPVFAATDDTALPVLSRGHIESIGDYPTDGTWVSSPDRIGTVGQSKRIEGFELKPGEGLPADMEIRYNVHVQNKGWLYDENDSSTWPKNGDYAGTRGESLRIEAIKIVLTDKNGKTYPGYHVQYRGHVQNVGDVPEDQTKWIADGDQLGTVGSSLRLEALTPEIVKDKSTSAVYDTAGTYGPATGSQTIDSDAVVAASGVTLQNLNINGNLIIDKAVGDGDVTLNNVHVTGELLVRGGGENSIHINGGSYPTIRVEATPTGAVRIVATDLSGATVVLSEDATGEELILEGFFEKVSVNAPDVTVTTRGNTSIGSFDLEQAAARATVNFDANTTVDNLNISGAEAEIKGTGTVKKAEVTADGAVFEKAPEKTSVDSGVVVPPVIPKPDPGSGGGGGYTPPKINLSVDAAATVTLAKIYDGTTAAAVTVQATVSGIVSGDVVTVTATAAYDNKNVGSDKDITITYSLSGTNAGKYNPPAATTVKGEITKKSLSSPASTAITKEFDGTATLNTVITENIGQTASDTLTITRTATYQNNSGKTDAIEVGSGKPVTCSYSLSGTAAANYSAPADHPGTGTITKRTLSVSATSLNINKTKTYDGTTAVYNSTGNSVINAPINVVTGVTSDPNISVTATADYDSQNVGSNRTITVCYTIGSTSANSRYQVIPTETISGASITPCQLTLPADQVPKPVAKAYDGTTDVYAAANNTGQIYETSVTPGNIATTDNGKVMVEATATYDAGKDVGTGKKITIHYTLSGDAAGNYLPLPDDKSKSADITPLTLTVGTLSDKEKEYDGDSTGVMKAAISCSDNNGVFQSEVLGNTLSSKTVSKYYTDSTCQTEASKYGTGLYLKYTVSLEGASADNYVFSGNNPSFTDTTTGGSITQKKLTVTAVVLGLETEKTYDGTTSATMGNATITGNSGLMGLIGSDKVTASALSNYDSAAAGARTITTTFALSGTDSGDDSSNYCIDSLTSSGKINPIQLSYTGNLPLPTWEFGKNYDGNTIVRFNGNTYDHLKTADSITFKNNVSGILDADKASVDVEVTATYDDKNVGENKPVTIAYTLSGTAAANYLAPLANTTAIKADIDKRSLAYDAGLKVETLKKENESSSAKVTGAAISTTADSANRVIAGDQVTLADADCTANYYYGDATTSAVGTSLEIRVNSTLRGDDAGNYQMESKTTTGQILPENGLITASYSSNSWTSWGEIWGAYQALTLPDGLKDLKLFMSDGNTFYGLNSDGKIYTSSDTTNLTNWNLCSTINNNKGGTYNGEALPMDYQVFGVDSDGIPMAVGSDGTIYYWDQAQWTSYSKITLAGSGAPLNPTYYKDNADLEYLIYQDSAGNIYKSRFGEIAPTTMCTGQTPPSDFTRQLIYVNSSTVVLFAY